MKPSNRGAEAQQPATMTTNVATEILTVGSARKLVLSGFVMFVRLGSAAYDLRDHRASTETDHTELEKIKETLQFMFRLEEIELYGAEKNPPIS